MEVMTGVITINSTTTEAFVVVSRMTERGWHQTMYEAKFLNPIGNDQSKIDMADILSLANTRKKVICIHAPEDLFDGVLIIGVA